MSFELGLEAATSWLLRGASSPIKDSRIKDRYARTSCRRDTVAAPLCLFWCNLQDLQSGIVFLILPPPLAAHHWSSTRDLSSAKVPCLPRPNRQGSPLTLGPMQGCPRKESLKSGVALCNPRVVLLYFLDVLSRSHVGCSSPSVLGPAGAPR